MSDALRASAALAQASNCPAHLYATELFSERFRPKGTELPVMCGGDGALTA
jgi:hypothetical protein